MSDKMRQALAWCARALDKDHPAAISARDALAEQPAQGKAVPWPMQDEAGLPLYAILASWADMEEQAGWRGKAKALRAASRALDPTWKACGRPECAASPAPTVPDGWKLVPVEPTCVMVQAGAKLVKNNLPIHTGTLDIYKAMLAAAPEVKS